jgi:protoheme IX farnesyltransferase
MSVRLSLAARRPSWAADYWELTKPNIVGMILVTVAAGFYLGTVGRMDGILLLHVLVGSALVAGGSNALNQVLERRIDARMRRTANRPLPAGRLAARSAAAFAWALGVIGVAYFAVFTNWVVTLLAAATLASYVFVYTPLKRKTSLNTLVGAVPGALPIVGGWAAARGSVGLEAWVLFALLYLWQLPHFLALAWICRDDYERAGLRMLSVTAGEEATFRQAVLYALALLPVSVMPAALGAAGLPYFLGAAALTLWLVWATVNAARARTKEATRRLFLATVLYLPAVLLLLTIDKAV